MSRRGGATFDRTVPALLCCLVAVCSASADAGVELRGDKVSTWIDGTDRAYLLEGNASLASEGGTLSGERMFVSVDETAAEKAGPTALRVYSEFENAGTACLVRAEGGVRVEQGAEIAEGKPVESDFLERANRALGAAVTGSGRPMAEAAAAEGAEEAQGTGSATASESREKDGREKPSIAARLIPADALPKGTSEITYSPIDADKYDMETQIIGNTTQIVITGGIEIGLVGYRMRAGNVVVRTVESEGGKVTQVQIYAEDNVRFTTPGERLEASRIFYDSADDTATLVDAELYARLVREDVPLVLRAERIKSYAGQLYKAENAYATTCEFGRPHYRLAARSANVIPIKHPDGTDSALVVSKDNRFIIGNATILYLPKVSRDIKDTYSPLRRVQAGNSDSFGNYVYTTWGLLDFLGGDTSKSWAARASTWSDMTGSVDYRGKRGTGGGIDYEYNKPEARGELRTYYIKDRGKDGDGFVPPSDDRGRAKWQQRTWLDKYQVDTELSYTSDRGFLNEYFEREAKEDSEQETYVYVKRPWEHAQASALYRARLNDFQSQVEYLPQGGVDVAGWPLMDGRIVYSSSTIADNARRRPDFALGAPSYQTQRIDTKHIFDAPLAGKGGLTVTPFATARESYFDDSATGERADRFAGSWGVKAGLPPAWRVYDVSSRLLNVNRLRHIASVDVTYEDAYNCTRRPTELLQFDEVDAAAETKIATVALRQRMQTKRDGAVEGHAPRTVDIWAWTAEADFYGDISDNNGHAWSDIRMNSRIAVTDDVSVVSDSHYDTYKEEFDKAGLWVRMDHSPRTTLALGHRYIRTVSDAVLSASVNHAVTDRWEVSAIAQYDFDNGEMLDERFVVRRNVHEFAVELAVRYDRGREDTSVGINVYPLSGASVRRF